ncbi:MAG: hypothetical protein AAF449_06280 [Myxococcota bacterium]
MRRPDLPPHNGIAFNRQLRFYRETHLLMPYMENMLEAHREESRQTWQTVHQHDAVARTFTRLEGDRVVASVTGLLTWEGTWMGQQLAADKERRRCSPGELLLTFLDHISPRSDCERMLFFSTRHNKKMTAIHSLFASMTGTADAMSQTEVDIWRTTQSSVALPPDYTLRPVRTGEKALISNAAQISFGKEGAKALSITSKRLFLPTVRRRFRSLGLDRARKVQIFDVRGIPSLAVFHEHASWGACLNGITNSTWLLPLHGGVNTAETVPSLLRHLGREENEPHRLIVVPKTVSPSTLQNEGLDHLVPLNMWVMNRAGLRRYFEFLNQHYAHYTATTWKDQRDARAS